MVLDIITNTLMIALTGGFLLVGGLLRGLAFVVEQLPPVPKEEAKLLPELTPDTPPPAAPDAGEAAPPPPQVAEATAAAPVAEAVKAKLEAAAESTKGRIPEPPKIVLPPRRTAPRPKQTQVPVVPPNQGLLDCDRSWRPPSWIDMEGGCVEMRGGGDGREGVVLWGWCAWVGSEEGWRGGGSPARLGILPLPGAN